MPASAAQIAAPMTASAPSLTAPSLTALSSAQPHKHWQVADLPWDKLDLSKVDPDVLKVVKAAALVEYNARDYTAYLCSVFHDDPKMIEDATYWAIEEVQHGKALGMWAEAVDPSFNHEEAFRLYREKIVINTAAHKSIRGSRAGEMVARCMVETGTSSYYTALGDATEEPVLKQICRNIAGDEHRHYKMFYDNLKRLLKEEKLNKWQRLRVALSRVAETEDDELAFAYYAANNNDGPYDRKTYNREYVKRAYSYYRPKHIERAVAMIFKASGLKPHTRAFNIATRTLCWYMDNRAKRLRAA